MNRCPTCNYEYSSSGCGCPTMRFIDNKATLKIEIRTTEQLLGEILEVLKRIEFNTIR